MLSSLDQDKAPREKKTTTHTLVLFSSVSLMSFRHPSREGSVSNGATPAVDPYSARCGPERFGYSSGLRPFALMEYAQLCFLWRESRERERAHTLTHIHRQKKSPCCGASQVGRALLRRFCALQCCARNGSPFCWQQCSLIMHSHTHTYIVPKAAKHYVDCRSKIKIYDYPFKVFPGH